MVALETSLLREKFMIYDTDDQANEKEPIMGLSNRMVLDLKSKAGTNHERYVVRAQNMHSCVRLSARIVRSYITGGPILNRLGSFDWDNTWDSIVSDYEQRFNPQRWACVYNKGKILFQSGKHDLLLDVIEQCAAKNDGKYDQVIPLAEDAFKQAGKPVSINYDSNVALVMDLKENESKCGVILRGPSRTTTFNFSVHPKKEQKLNIPQVMAISSAFLEGVQLGFMIGMNNEKIRLGIIPRHSDEEKQTREAKRRISRLNAEIAGLESVADVHYRPERPEFPHVIIEAEKLARQIIKPPTPDDEEWVE